MADNKTTAQPTSQLPVYVITGATGAIGKIITRRLAAQGKPLVLACPNMQSGKALAEEIAAETLNRDICCLPLDLASFNSVKQLAAELTNMGRPVAALINNANAMPPLSSKTDDGYETTVQVNFLGVALLVHLLVPLMTRGARIVLSTSLVRNLTSLPYEFPAVNRFIPVNTYAQSKLALTLFSIYLSTTLRTSSVSVNCADPGMLNAGMLTVGHWFDKVTGRTTNKFLHKPEEGAIATLRALESSDTGFIFKGLDKQVKTSSILKNREVFIRLCNDTMRIIKKQL